MPSQTKPEIDDLAQCLRDQGPSAFQNFITAGIIWLFGVLVFVPLANSLNWQTGLLCSLIVFTSFTIFVYRATLSFKKLIDAFSFLPARKYGSKRGMKLEEAITLFRYVIYIIFAIVVYALYFPLLTSFHFAVSGIVLIVLIIWIFFLALRILSILSFEILEQLKID